MKRIFLIALILCAVALTAFCETGEETGSLAIGDVICGFRLESIDEVDLFQSTLYNFVHEKTGAELCYMANEDTNRCFTIGFHTPVSTDTGVAHVFEHAAMGGSKKYPDPNLVVSMMVGTYSTYLNAYTETTYTAFQASSLSEEQLLADMDVFLDGVFHPLITEDEHAMMREAYRYELTDRDSPITLQGIVYSEMQGSINHNRMTELRLDRLMYPGSQVGSLSGGLPEEIPNMTYQDLCDFHEQYYVPSNSLTVLYGNIEIERYLELVNEYFSEYEHVEIPLEDAGYRKMEGDLYASYTFPVSEDSEPETLMYYAIPVEDLTTVEEYILSIGLDIMSWPEHYFDRRISEEFPECTWMVSTGSTKQGVSIIFFANGIEADQHLRFREICDGALNDVIENGFDPADIRVYADSARYANAVRGEDMDGLNVAAGLIDCWNSRGDARQVVDAYDIMCHPQVLETDGRCNEVFKKAVESAYGHVMVVSQTDIGGREREEAETEQRLADMKAAMTEEELDALIARTEDYNAWLEAASATSMLSQVTVVTVDNLPEEVIRAYARREEMDGLSVVASTLRRTDYITNDLIMDASAVPQEYLLPLRMFCMLACRLETANRDRITLGRDIERAANNLWFNMGTLENVSEGTWIPVFEITWNTFKDLAEESVELIQDIADNTMLTDLAYIRSMVASDALDRRASYKIGLPYSMAVQEAGRQTDAQSAYTLQYGGHNFIEYEERLAAMDDDELAKEMEKIKTAVSLVMHSDHATLAVAGDREAVNSMKTLVKEYISGYEPMGEPLSYVYELSERVGNTAYMLDTGVSYNLEYMSMDELGLQYTPALNAFSNLALDQVLMPVFRYENSAYSVFFQLDYNRALVLTYRDPNLAKTFNEIFPSLGDAVRSVLETTTQEDLDGYISSAYTSEAMPIGMIGRASNAILSELNHYDYFEERLNNMKSLKSLTIDDLLAYTEILDRLDKEGLKMTVTSPQKLEEAADLFVHVNTDFLK